MTSSRHVTPAFGYLTRLGLGTLLILLIAVAYHAAPQNGFHLDDADNIVRRGTIHMETFTTAALHRAATEGLLPKRVIPNVSFAVDWWRGGGSPRAFQETNILIHIAAAMALAWLIRTILGLCGATPRAAWLASCAAAALWALHPIQVQAVTYIVQRMTSLAALFMLLTVSAYIRARTGPRPLLYFPLAALCAIGAILSKENAYILPLLLLLTEYTLCRRGGQRTLSRFDWIALSLPLAGAAYALIDLAFLQGPVWRFIMPAYEMRDFTPAERLLTQPRVIFFHLGQIFFPLPGRFSIEHDFPVSSSLFTPWTTLPAILGVAAWACGGLWLAVRSASRVAGFFILWLPLTLLIESSIVPLEMLFEHRMYLPSAGLAGLVALGLHRCLADGRPRATLGLTLTVTVGLSLMLATIQRVPDWRTSITLLERTVESYPGMSRTWANLGTAYESEHRSHEAIAAYTQAIALEPGRALSYLNRGSSHLKLGELAAAEADYRRFLALQPRDFRGKFALGKLYLASDRPAEAESQFRQAIELEPTSPLPLLELGHLLLQTGRPADAIPMLTQAARLDPALADSAHFSALGAAYGRSGQYPAAEEAFRNALERNPEDIDAWINLGLAQLRGGKPQQALATLDRALTRAPDHPRALNIRAAAVEALARSRAGQP